MIDISYVWASWPKYSKNIIIKLTLRCTICL